MEIIECVPNISEGRNKAIIKKIAQAIESVPNIQLLNIDSGYHAHRTVYTFLGAPQQVVQAAFAMYKESLLHINMQLHAGVHPRMGAVDVCPLIPIKNIDMSSCTQFAHELASKVATELHIPVYAYEYNAKQEYRKKLEHIRKGEYEGLLQKMTNPLWKPDYGPHEPHSEFGATIIGARQFLLAYNINLQTSDVQIAKNIAAQIRESGGAYTSPQGEKLYATNGLKGVKAIGWHIKEFDRIQVSTNITDSYSLSFFDVFNAVSSIAQKYNCTVTGSELIGLTPLHAIIDSAQKIAKHTKVQIQNNKDLIKLAINYLNLNEIKPFNYQKQIIEYAANII